MQKLPLRPLRLTRVNKYQLEVDVSAENSRSGEEEDAEYAEELAFSSELHSNSITETTLKMPIDTSDAQQAQKDREAQRLLMRTPNNYLFSQAYGLWLYLSLFLITIILTHIVSTAEYGTYASIQTAINTITYIIALGLEDAIVTFVPRVSVERGKAAAGRLIRQLLVLRIVILLACACVILFGLPVLAWLINLLPIQGASAMGASLTDPALLAHTRPVALYILGIGIVNMLQSVCAAQMRMLRVLIVGGLMQVGLLIFGFVVLHLGWGIDGILWIQAIVALVGAALFLAWLAPLFLVRETPNKQPLRPVLQVGISAWLTNLASGALFKQISITLLAIYLVSQAGIGYFNLSFQLADAANVLLVSGFAGVGASALAASFVGNNYERLGRSWQSLIKVETLLAAPGLVFCLFNAQSLATALYGSKFAAVGPLLAIFLVFNIFFRVIGTTIHQSSLYIIGKAYTVVISQWVSLLLLVAMGIILVPRFGPAGALIADGIAKALSGILMLVFLIKKLPRRYPLELLGFTLRFLLALTVAALPGLFWHPSSLSQLVLSALLFLVLCLAVLTFIKPLNTQDLEMILATKPSLARYIRWFVQRPRGLADG
jgi:O-antigen/teichoic acid export membrane protein